MFARGLEINLAAYVLAARDNITKWQGTSAGIHVVKTNCRAVEGHRTCTGVHLVSSKHLIAMIAYVTKWHGTSAGAIS